MTVSELSRDEFKHLIGEAVEEKLLELLGDPDEGLVLREEVQARLQRTLAAERAGRRGAGEPSRCTGPLGETCDLGVLSAKYVNPTGEGTKLRAHHRRADPKVQALL